MISPTTFDFKKKELEKCYQKEQQLIQKRLTEALKVTQFLEEKDVFSKLKSPKNGSANLFISKNKKSE